MPEVPIAEVRGRSRRARPKVRYLAPLHRRRARRHNPENPIRRRHVSRRRSAPLGIAGTTRRRRYARRRAYRRNPVEMVEVGANPRRRHPRRRNPDLDVMQGLTLVNVFFGVGGALLSGWAPRQFGLTKWGGVAGSAVAAFFSGFVAAAVSSPYESRANAALALLGGMIPTADRLIKEISGGKYGITGPVTGAGGGNLIADEQYPGLYPGYEDNQDIASYDGVSDVVAMYPPGVGDGFGYGIANEENRIA